jgi:hypothetical protein
MENGESEGEEVVEEKRKMERKKKKLAPLSPMKILPLELRKTEIEDEGRVSHKVQPPLEFCSGSATSYCQKLCMAGARCKPLLRVRDRGSLERQLQTGAS